MEKCSFCVQRINAATRIAKRTGNDDSIAALQTACAQACPTDALVFGNLNNPDSQVAQMFDDDRSYVLQESLGTQPNVRYLKQVDEDAHASEVANAH
jgi:molybdopterin-containing oxidoreductase family iron-sulfur binding subunit|tara:strand:+ start:136 stop:426 length:291 start_codon:yes stop_codon:yes gene_type:complete